MSVWTMEFDDEFDQLLLLARDGEEAAVLAAVEMHPPYLSQRGGGGYAWTLLHRAAKEGNLSLTAALLDRGAEVNQRSAGGYDALLLAARAGFVDVCALLLDRGADPNTRSVDWTALGYAAYEDHLDVAKLLLARGADLHTVILGGRTALQWYGLGCHDHPADSPRPRLSNEQKDQRREQLQAEFASGPLVLQRRRDANWERRKGLIVTLVCSGFQPLAAARAQYALEHPPLPTWQPIPALPNSTPAERRALQQGHVFGHSGLWKIVVSFL